MSIVLYVYMYIFSDFQPLQQHNIYKYTLPNHIGL